MPLAGIELAYLVKEIETETQGYYVSNIWGINRNSLLFKLHHPKKPDIMLMISTTGMWVTSKKIDSIEPNKLLRRLRSDLLRSKIEKIEQIGTERIAYLTFSNFDNRIILIVEFFGEGNLLLCNYNKKILALLHSIDVKHRQLRVGVDYNPPPTNNIDVINFRKEEFKKILSSSTTIGKTIGRGLGLPKKYVEEIIRLSSINREKPSNQLSNDEIESLYDIINTTISNVIEGNHDPTIINDGEISEVFPIRFSDDNTKAKKVSSFNNGLDVIFSEQILQKGKSLYSDTAEKKIKELENTLDEQKKAISVVLEKSKQIANIANLFFTMQSEGKSDIKDPTIIEVLHDKNSELIKEKGVSILQIGDSKIKINPDLPLPSIASKLFDESKKQKSAIKSIEKLIKKTEDKLEKTIQKGEIARGSIGFAEVRKKSWFERYRWFFTSDGILAVGGRDSSSNSAIIRKYVEKDDKVFHAEINGSPFFILKDRNDKIMPLSISETSQATVCFSRAWKEGMYGVNCYWVTPEQVKKAAPSGQTMGKGSFIIEGTRNYNKISTLKLAVGILHKEENYLLVCGPPEPIKNTCVCYAVIEPGSIEIADMGKRIRANFVGVDEKFAKMFVVDDYVRVLPTGGSKITETGILEN
ncbi:ribosome rescue protein RqcH [Candidatus Nitrosopelagicus sp.]|nr:ribosome rescue protein RqcH [Candidatus Nitrosopelagicus sp.]